MILLDTRILWPQRIKASPRWPNPVESALIDIVSTGLVATGVLFVIGLLIGVIIKKTVKLGLAILALLILLTATGYITLTPQQIAQGIIQRTASLGPGGVSNITSQAQGLANILPYTSLAFIVGIALGLWKG